MTNKYTHLIIIHHNSTDLYTRMTDTYRWVSARLWYLHCFRSSDTIWHVAHCSCNNRLWRFTNMWRQSKKWMVTPAPFGHPMTYACILFGLVSVISIHSSGKKIPASDPLSCQKIIGVGSNLTKICSQLLYSRNMKAGLQNMVINHLLQNRFAHYRCITTL